MINTLRQFLLSALLLSVPGSIAIAQATDAGAVDPATQYRVLQWHELVPENWEPPLVPPAHDTVASSGVDPAAVVSDLDQRLVSLPGYSGPYTHEGLRQAWGVYAPAARVTVEVSALDGLVLQLLETQP